VGYRELLQALEEEVGRQIRERRAQASRECQLLLDTARGELTAGREKVLAEERRRQAEETARALSRARLEEERAILGEMRRLMEDVRHEAERRLPSLNDPELLGRLVDEVVPELGEGPIQFRVREGGEEHLAAHLGRNHPGLLPRSKIVGTPDVRGGVEVSLGGRQRFDNTLRARLLVAWQRLEPEIAALLFRPDDVPPPAPSGKEPVGAASVVGEGDGGL
jgi:vacuolar-type H+-ATPase subunit E/Vma4